MVFLFLINIKLDTVSIVCMTCQPVEFDKWLKHYFDIGVSKIYLRVEDTPELKNIIKNDPRIHAEFHPKVESLDANKQMDRQTQFVDKIINICDTNWIIHIDDDELVSPNFIGLRYLLSFVPKRYDCVFMKTKEVVYRKGTTDKCFGTAIEFIDCHKEQCKSYMGGKSCGRVSKKLKSNGVHYFNGEVLNINEHLLFVKHYDSCTFNRWKDKFSRLSGEGIKDGFKFYHDSIKIIKDGNDNDMLKFYLSNKYK